MKKFILLITVCIFAITACACENESEYLARVVAGNIEKEPFIVKVAFCEMILNMQKKGESLQDTVKRAGFSRSARTSESDMHAAIIAFSDMNFFPGITNYQKCLSVPNFVRY